MTGRSGEAFGLFRIGPFPLAPFLCPFPNLLAFRKPLGIGVSVIERHDQCGTGQSRQAGAAGSTSGLAQSRIESVGLGFEISRAPFAERLKVGKLPPQGGQFGCVRALHQRPVGLGAY